MTAKKKKKNEKASSPQCWVLSLFNHSRPRRKRRTCICLAWRPAIIFRSLASDEVSHSPASGDKNGGEERRESERERESGREKEGERMQVVGRHIFFLFRSSFFSPRSFPSREKKKRSNKRSQRPWPPSRPGRGSAAQREG